MKIQPVLLFDDNYCYFLTDDSTGETAVVDPADPDAVLKYADDHGIRISSVLTTHKHWDHAGGNEKLASSIPDLKVYGGANEPIPAMTHPLEDGATVALGSSVQIRTISAPCHTSGHVLFYAQDSATGQRVLFSGDTIFIGGAGKFFEGDGVQMQKNFDRIAALPDDTLIYCGHEYTESNLKYGLAVEPDNETIKRKLDWAIQQGEKDIPTIPSTVGDEKQHNVFMRTHLLMPKFQATSPADCMSKLRAHKDSWKPK